MSDNREVHIHIHDDRVVQALDRQTVEITKWLALLTRAISDQADSPTQAQIDELTAQVNASTHTVEQAINEQKTGG